jgi:hypothetical protein
MDFAVRRFGMATRQANFFVTAITATVNHSTNNRNTRVNN